jgi:hypothetical protein
MVAGTAAVRSLFGCCPDTTELIPTVGPAYEPPQREFPPLNAEAGYADNLPLELTRFFGREADGAWPGETLVRENVRLVTTTGRGKCRKASLAEGAYRPGKTPIERSSSTTPQTW